MDFTVTLTDAEHKALAFVALDPAQWIDSAAHERCRVAMDEIVQICVAKCLEAGVPIPGSKDAMVELAYAQGWIETAEQRQAMAQQSMARG